MVSIHRHLGLICKWVARNWVRVCAMYEAVWFNNQIRIFVSRLEFQNQVNTCIINSETNFRYLIYSITAPFQVRVYIVGNEWNQNINTRITDIATNLLVFSRYICLFRNGRQLISNRFNEWSMCVVTFIVGNFFKVTDNKLLSWIRSGLLNFQVNRIECWIQMKTRTSVRFDGEFLNGFVLSFHL